MTGRVITFELARPTLTLNQLLALKRQGDWAVSNHKKALAWEIKLACVGKLPSAPFERARLTIERLSRGTPDDDGLWGGLKLLIDCLLPQGDPRPAKRGSRKMVFPHPFGLGIVADDCPRVLTTKPVAIRVRSAAEQKTKVTIEEL